MQKEEVMTVTDQYGRSYGYITNCINDKGKVRQFSDCTHGSKDPNIDDNLPF